MTIIKRDRTFEGITPEGERVILWARQVLASLEGLRQEADLMRSVPRGDLSIGVIPTASHAATLLSAEYREVLPQLTLEVMLLGTREILQHLKSQDLYLGMLYDRSLIGDEYDVLPLFAERYVLVASEQASLPHELGWAEVADLPLCLLSRDMQNRQTLGEIFRGVDATPNVVLETNAMRVLLMECLSGRAFIVMPLSGLPTYPEGGRLRIHTITPEHAEDERDEALVADSTIEDGSNKMAGLVDQPGREEGAVHGGGALQQHPVDVESACPSPFLPVRKPAPSGLEGKKPIPSSSQNNRLR